MSYDEYLAALRDVRDEMIALTARRDDLMRKCAAQPGAKQADIAAAAGLTPSRVSQIAPMRKARAAAQAAVATAATGVATQERNTATATVATVATAQRNDGGAVLADDAEPDAVATAALPLRTLPRLGHEPLRLSALEPATRRTWPDNPRSTAFLDTDSGVLVWRDTEYKLDLGDRSAAAILRALPLGDRGPLQRLYIVGTPPWFPRGQVRADLMSWLYGPLPDGWHQAKRAHFPGPKFPVARYRSPWNIHGKPVELEVRHVAEWLDYGDYSVTDAVRAMRLVWEKLRAKFGTGVQLRGGTASTGKDLWLRTIGRHPIPVLSDEIREWIVSTSGQGRFELFTDLPDTIPGAYEYDCTFAYSAHTWGLGTGDPTRITPQMWERADEKQRERWLRGRSRFEVSVTVPAGWSGVGVIPAAVEIDGQEKWQYPSRPGTSWITTCSGEELWLARQQGWQFDIRDGMWQADRLKPLNQWTEHLTDIWSELGRLAEFHTSDVGRDVPRATAAKLARKAIRNVLLHTIGSFGSHWRDELGVTSVDDADSIPAGADFDVVGDVIQWRRRVQIPADQTSHPEWWANVVARQRIALLHARTPTPGLFAGGLHTEPGDIIAFRADAIWTTRPMPGWENPDDTRGMYRLKKYHPNEVPAPRTRDELLALRDTATDA